MLSPPALPLLRTACAAIPSPMSVARCGLIGSGGDAGCGCGVGSAGGKGGGGGKAGFGGRGGGGGRLPTHKQMSAGVQAPVLVPWLYLRLSSK